MRDRQIHNAKRAGLQSLFSGLWRAKIRERGEGVGGQGKEAEAASTGEEQTRRESIHGMERRWDMLASAEEGSLGVRRACLLKGHGNHMTDQASRSQHSHPFLAIKKRGVRHSRLKELQWQILVTASCLFLGTEFFLGGGQLRKLPMGS